MSYLFEFFRLALGVLITGLCCGIVLAGNQSRNICPYVTQSLQILHPQDIDFPN